MQAVDITLNNHDCKDLFIHWYTRKTLIPRISILIFSGLNILCSIVILLWYFKHSNEYFLHLACALIPCLMFMISLFYISARFPCLKFNEYQNTLTDLRTSGCVLKSICFYPQCFLLNFEAFHLSESRTISYQDLKKIALFPSGIVFIFDKKLPPLCVDKTAFLSDSDFETVTLYLKSLT